MILVIDHYDSFVHNLARYVRELGYADLMRRHDDITLDEITALNPSHIILSPGPCTPNEASRSIEIVRHFTQIPILGVCLGHQVIGQAFGGTVMRAQQPMHGRSSQIWHNQSSIFAGIPSGFNAARYHSLIVSPEKLPTCLEVTARTEEGDVMAIQHQIYPIVGVQFHPESVLTEYGHRLLQNFLSNTSHFAETKLHPLSVVHS